MIKFTRHKLVGKELEYIKDALEIGIGGGNSKYTKLCEEFLMKKFGIRKVLLTPSCSHALEMIALLIDTHPGDEFIMPSFTYVSTANVFVKHGGVPVFVDINPDTLNMDESEVAEKITDKTKAIVVVDYGGISPNMDELMKTADEHGIMIIEDAAQGVNAKYKGRYLGTFGSLGCYSFHETKNYSMGEGGALLINDEKFVNRAVIMRNRGTNKEDFLKGYIESYTWVDIGAGYYVSDLNAAVLLARLEKLEYIQSYREKLWKIYYSELFSLERKGMIRLPYIPDYSEPNWHIFYMLTESEKTRRNLINFLSDHGIQAVFHYIPLHESPYYLKHFQPVSLPVTERVARTIVRLPLNESLKESDVLFITKVVKKFFGVS